MLTIPFYSNTKDDAHCVQACMRMILKYYFPQKKFSFAYLDKMLKVKKHGKGSMPQPAAEIVVLAKLGLNAILYGTSDDKRWALEGKKYVKKRYSPQEVEWICARTDFKIDKYFILQSFKEKRNIKRKLSFSDVETAFRKGYLVELIINNNVLLGKPGYEGHAVLIVDLKPHKVMIHDPGLPPKPNRQITRKKLIAAWDKAGTDNIAIIVKGIKK